MNKKIRTIVVFALFIVFVIGVFYFFSNDNQEITEETDQKVSVMSELLSKNMNQFYPPTPREVLRYYNDITKAIYDEDYSKDEMSNIAIRIRELFDAELVGNQTDEEYLKSLTMEKQEYREKGLTISEYAISSATDVETYQKDGYEWAKLYTMYNVRQELNGTITYQKVNQVFLLRKEQSSGHWKIYGFELVE